METKICPGCRGRFFDPTGFGLDSCTGCGRTVPGQITDNNPYILRDRVVQQTTYTRRKRFRKYLMRTNRTQSHHTVPEETWVYLMARGPYRSPGHVHQTLKAAKHLKRKCYDSLPLLCTHLCPNITVPMLGDDDIFHSLRLFDVVDRKLRRDNMISYLFCLEYILEKVGRSDVLPYINRIKCPRRRRNYRERLDRMFREKQESVVDLLCVAVPL